MHAIALVLGFLAFGVALRLSGRLPASTAKLLSGWVINVALPGIALRALPVAPRQLPYYAGSSYFELDRSSPYWAALARAGGIAIHITGDVPGLEMECWAIRR